MSKSIDHSQRGHSNVGASSSERWMNCTKSVSFIANLKASGKIREQEESIYAAEGTIAHELCEFCLEEKVDPISMIGKEFQGHLVDHEMAEAVEVYVDFIKENHKEGMDLLLEEKFVLDHIDSELYGSGDATIVEPFGKVMVVDFKYGKGIAVEAENNPQLLYYALGATKGFEDFEEVELVIVQPRADKTRPIKRWTVPKGRLEEFAKELKVKLDETRSDNAKFMPTDKGCKFCDAKAHCPALKEQAMETAMVAFDEVGTPTLPSIDSIPSEKLPEIMKVAPLIEGFLKAVAERAHQEAEKGIKIEGYKLVKKRANRKWTDEKRVIEEFEDIFDEKDLFAPRKLRTPAQLEKVVGKADVAKLTITPDTGTSLVPVSDKRKEVKPAIEAFSEVEDDFDDL